MSLTPSKVTWDPNRYKAHEYVITYDSNGNPTLSKKEADYTGVNYNFASLPSGTSTTSQTQTGTTVQSGTTTQQQTSEAFGDVKPYYWDDKDNDAGNKELTGSGYGGAQPPDNTLSGFFKPLEDAAQGKKIGSLGQRVKQKFEDISGKTERDWEDVDTYMEREKEFESNRALQAKYGTFQEYNKALDSIQGKDKDTTIGSKIGKAPQVLGLGVRTASKLIGGVFEAILGVTEADRQRQRHAKQYFNKKGIKTRGDLGSSVDPGRIVGNPSKDLFAGMNAVSAKGNLEKAGAKRITTRNSKKTQDRLIARYGADSERVKKFNQDTRNMENELNDFTKDKNDFNIKSYNKKKDAQPVSQLNPNEMRNVAETGDSGGEKGGKSIICTQMYQQTQLEDWKKTMRLWYIFQKKYLTMEHQEGYHFLFKPFVNGMKKSKVLTALGKHCAIARTNDIKHIMFGTPFSLSGRLVRLVTEPICYITGKIKSWL